MRFDIDTRVARARAWQEKANELPLFGFFLGSQYPLHRFPGCAAHLRGGPVDAEDIVVSDYLGDFEHLHELYSSGGGELVWSASPFFGLPWVEASLGCGVIADLTSGSTRTVPPDNRGASFVVPEFSPDNAWVRKMIEFIDPLERLSRGRFPVGVTLMRGISDLLAAVYGSDRFVYAAVERPDLLAEQAMALAGYWIDMGKHLLSNLPLFRGGTGSFFYSVWCRGSTIWLQEDAAALLSPDLYERIVFPAVSEISEAFENVVIHLHPSQFIPIDYLLETRINAIELHIDIGGPSAEELATVHRKILADRPLIVWGDMTTDDLEWMLDNLPYKGLAINMVANTVDKTPDIWSIYETRTAERERS